MSDERRDQPDSEAPRNDPPADSEASEITPRLPEDPDAAPVMFSAVDQAAPRLWRPRDLLVFVLLLVAGLVVCQLLAVAAYAALRPLVGWRAPVGAVAQNPIFLVIVQAISYLFVLAAVYLLVVTHYQQPFWSGLAWRPLSLGRILQFVAGGLLLAVVMQIIPALLPERKTFPLEKLFNSPAADYALGLLSVVLAPFMEELIFRGVLFAFFESCLGLGFAVVGTAVLFAALHVPEYWGAWSRALVILLVGLTLSLIRARTRSLAPCVVVHTAYNATLMVGLFFTTHHFHSQPAVLWLRLG